jgi:hypothetical protein
LINLSGFVTVWTGLINEPSFPLTGRTNCYLLDADTFASLGLVTAGDLSSATSTGFALTGLSARFGSRSPTGRAGQAALNLYRFFAALINGF